MRAGQNSPELAARELRGSAFEPKGTRRERRLTRVHPCPLRGRGCARATCSMAGGHGARRSSRLGGLEAQNNKRFGREECGEGGEAHWRDENSEDGPERRASRGRRRTSPATVLSARTGTKPRRKEGENGEGKEAHGSLPTSYPSVG